MVPEKEDMIPSTGLSSLGLLSVSVSTPVCDSNMKVECFLSNLTLESKQTTASCAPWKKQGNTSMSDTNDGYENPKRFSEISSILEDFLLYR